MPKRTDAPAGRQPTPPREDRAATEPATLEAVRADYADGAADRAALDRHIARYHSEWSK